jgi:aminopeptidase
VQRNVTAAVGCPGYGASMDAATRLTAYAELAVNVGAAVRPGVTVNLGCDLEHAELAYEIAAAAYRAGAARVIVDYRDVRIRRAAIENAPIEALTATDPWEIARLEHMRDTGAAFIRLTGQADQHAFDGLDPAKLSAVQAELGNLSRQVLTSGDVSWTILAAPNAGWAEQVFGEPDVERLWDKVAVVMRLDEPDPVAAWRQRDAELRARAASLDALGLDAVRYHGEGTELTVGLIPDHVWTGGGLTDVRGARFMPNLPTEEVFTSPDNRRADGVIRLTRPLVLREGVVEGLVVTFEGGRVVDVAADSGADIVRAQHATDDGAVRLGEVSLVDGTSRVRAAGRGLPRHPLRRERRLPRGLGRGLPVRRPWLEGPRSRRARGARPQPLARAHRRRGRRPGRERHRRARRRHDRADHRRRRLGAPGRLTGAR